MSVLELLERPNLINKEKQLSAIKLAANVQIIGLLSGMVEKWDPVLGPLDPPGPLGPQGPPEPLGPPGTLTPRNPPGPLELQGPLGMPTTL